MPDAARPPGWQAEALRPIPLVILTGFLGAGKTSLLNRALKDAALADTLVIVNEFGEMGLDHLLIEAATGDMVLMAAGCLCCTIRGDLVMTLEDLLRRRDNHRIAFFRRVVIETTGLADPLPVLQAVLEHPYLSKRFEIAGVITLIDALNGAATLAAHPEARRQVALADHLVMTMTDLAPEAVRRRLMHDVAALNPLAAQMLSAPADPAQLFTQQRFDPGRLSDAGLLAWLDGAGAATPHDHKAGHDANRHGADIEAFTFISDQAVSLGALTVFREAMRVLHGPKLLRMKGLVALRENPDQPVAIHTVQHVAHPPVSLPHWPSRDRRTRLVFITQGLPRATIEAFWTALIASDQAKV